MCYTEAGLSETIKEEFQNSCVCEQRSSSYVKEGFVEGRRKYATARFIKQRSSLPKIVLLWKSGAMALSCWSSQTIQSYATAWPKNAFLCPLHPLLFIKIPHVVHKFDNDHVN